MPVPLIGYRHFISKTPLAKELQLIQLLLRDYVIELGPGGGEAGGQILFSGTPVQMLEATNSVTAPFLHDTH